MQSGSHVSRNTTWKPERTQLELAAISGDLDAWEAAIEDGLVPAADAYQETPLHLAARHGHVDMVKLLVNGYKLDVNATNFEAWTPLCCAVAHGHMSVAKLLLKYGGRPDHVTSTGSTLLHLAAWHAQSECVHWLVQQGMNVTQSNAFACMPVDMAPPGPVRATLLAKMKSKMKSKV